MAWLTHVGNVLAPGTGLLAVGRAISGGLLLGGALLCLCLLSLTFLGIPGFEGGLLPWLGGYLVLGVASEAWWLVVSRVPVLDEPAVRAAHREAATAYLARDLTVARAAGARLCRLARREPGAWRLQALILDADHDPAGAGAARARAASLEESGGA